MNPRHETPPTVPDEGRAPALLRRAGVVERTPPESVWRGIVAALSSSSSSSPTSDERGVAGGGAPVVPLGEPVRGRRNARRRAAAPWALVAAAAAGALVTWAGLGLAEAEDQGQPLASGSLTPLAAPGPSGSAEVVTVDGQQRLRVELTGQPDAGDGYLEVWLLRPDVSGMVTLGVLDGQSGEFALPEGVDLGEYPVVDISREHLDGDPAHGGDSLVRGEVG